MCLILLLFFVFSAKFALVKCSNWDCADYYWRDYYGVTPDDAVPAGKDHNGNSLYIGLAYIRGFELLPATILPKQGIGQTTAYANVVSTNQHVKILCSPHKEAFEWITIQSKDLHEYTKRNLIPGGSAVGESLYICRVFKNNNAIVGKVFRHERQNRGCWFPFNNSPAGSLTYDILSYNCDKADRPIFDVRSNLSNNKN